MHFMLQKEFALRCAGNEDSSSYGRLSVICNYLYKGTVPDFLKRQQAFYNDFYSWDRRKSEWSQFLQGLLNEHRSKL